MTSHSLEAQLILNCLRAFARGEMVSEWAEGIQWERVMMLGASQRLLPILQATLNNTLVPAEIRQQLEHATRQQRIRTAILLEAFATVNEAFSDANIPVMPVKGVFLAHRVYPSVNHRYFDDIDLLVPKPRARDAVAIMQRLGYVVHPRAQKPDWHHLAPFLHEKSQTVIELHTDVIRRAQSGWDVAEIWQRAERGRMAGVDTYLISEPDALIDTALHARHSLNKRLSFFLDAHLQLRRIQANNLDKQLAQSVREAGASVALAYLEEVGVRILGFAAARHAAAAPQWRLRLTDRLSNWDTLDRRNARQVEGPLPNLLELLLMDRWSHSARMGYRLIFPPPQFLAEFYGAHQTRNYGKRFVARTRRFAQQIFNKH